MKLYFDLVEGTFGVDRLTMLSYDISLRRLIGDNLEAGVKPTEIAQQLGVSNRLVTYYRKKLATWGDVVTPPIAPRGRKYKLHPAAVDAIADQLAVNPTMYLDELQVWLEEEWDIEVSLPTISRCLKRMNKTHKKSQRINEARDPALRAA